MVVVVVIVTPSLDVAVVATRAGTTELDDSVVTVSVMVVMTILT